MHRIQSSEVQDLSPPIRGMHRRQLELRRRLKNVEDSMISLIRGWLRKTWRWDILKYFLCLPKAMWHPLRIPSIKIFKGDCIAFVAPISAAFEYIDFGALSSGTSVLRDILAWPPRTLSPLCSNKKFALLVFWMNPWQDAIATTAITKIGPKLFWFVNINDRYFCLVRAPLLDCSSSAVKGVYAS